MKNALQTVSIGLGTLALGTGLAAQMAAPVITNITMVGATPQFAVQSNVGITNQIQYCTDLSQANWVVLTNLMVVQSPYWFVDVGAPLAAQRFYRVAALAASIPAPCGMAPIPAGSFTMGDTLDGESDALPLHTNYLSAFYVDTNLVSYALWQRVYQWATTNGYSFDNAGSGQAATQPVQTIGWYDVVKWCNARSEMEGVVPAYYTDAAQTAVYRTGQVDVVSAWVNWSGGYRLPTEAEWESAARGGVAGHRFPWSDADSIDWTRANYYSYWSGGHPYYAFDVNPTSGFDTNFTGGGSPYTSPVGSFAPNGYGLHDMAGNVFEWCWDWYDSGYYSLSPGTDPHGPASSPSGSRVSRGGSWFSVAYYSRCAARGYYSPTITFDSIGFRCVRGF